MGGQGGLFVMFHSHKISYVKSDLFRKSHHIIKSHSSDHFLDLSSRRNPITPTGRVRSTVQTDTVVQRPVPPGSPKESAEPKRGIKHLSGDTDQHNVKVPPIKPAADYSYGRGSPRVESELVSEVESPKTPLTKKRWLESSDPGLFGSTTSKDDI